MSLIEKIRKSRQSGICYGDWIFTVTRPTDMDMLDLQSATRANRVTQGELLKRFVIDWSGVTETDVIPGGSGVPVAFSADLFAEWIADRPYLWEALTEAIIGGYKAHELALEESAKNSMPG